MEDLKEIQVAGLLHDLGKFVRKYNGGKGKHGVLSGELIECNKELTLGCSVDNIVGLVASHHSDDSQSFEKTVGVEIKPGTQVTATLADKVYDSAKNVDKDLLRILTMADSLSASSDRRSETSGGTAGHCEYAPLWSPIAQVFGSRLAVKSGSNYQVYEYTGNDDSKETVTSQSNDSDFNKNVLNSFRVLTSEMEDLTDVESLISLLEKCWSTVNANTWRPAGSTLGNTTTSLFDHSKTTSAIAGCLLVNKQNRVNFSSDSPNIDIWHLTYVGKKLNVRDAIKNELSKVGLSSACIIGSTDNEIYFMFPSSEFKSLTENIKQLNAKMYTEYGETINFEVAKNWQFKNCDKALADRFSTKFTGVLDVIGKVDAKEAEVETITDEDKTVGGYKVNHYNYILNQIIANNDSISKLATTLRIFEMFSRDAEKFLREHNCKVIEASFDKCIYTVNKEDVHKIEVGINTIYKKYVLNVSGLTFSSITANRYVDGVGLLESELEDFSARRKTDDAESYVKIRDKVFKIAALEYYNKVLKESSVINKSTLFKVLKLYDDILQYSRDNNAEHLVSLSKFMYVIANESDENSKAFELKCMQAIWDDKQSKIKSLATVYYEAILEASRRKQ